MSRAVLSASKINGLVQLCKEQAGTEQSRLGACARSNIRGPSISTSGPEPRDPICPNILSIYIFTSLSTSVLGPAFELPSWPTTNIHHPVWARPAPHSLCSHLLIHGHSLSWAAGLQRQDPARRRNVDGRDSR